MPKSKIITTIIIFLTFFVFADDRPIVHNIVASSNQDKIISIFWELPKEPSPKINEICVFKSIKPINSFYDISKETPLAVLSATDTFYSDAVDDFSDYYYAVVAKTDSGLYDVVIPSLNSTVSAAHLKMPKLSENAKTSASAKEKIIVSSASRTTPLPFLDLLENQNANTIKMSDKAHQIALELQKSYSPKENKITDVYVFEEDLILPEGGDDFLLFEVLKTTFIQRKYKEAVEQLDKLIGTNISKDVSNRATFYLAESYYFSKIYDVAALTFLKLYDVYPSLTKHWIDSSLDLYKLP